MKITATWKCNGMLPVYSGTSDMYTCIVYETNNAVVLHGIFYHVFVEKTCCEITVRPPSDAAKGRAWWIL